MPANRRISAKLDKVLDDVELIRDLAIKVQEKLHQLKSELSKNTENPKRK